ncbi:PAS domain-containing protein [Galbibacter sp. BG1]|uniref:chemotaxis protein CheB n=1 Tax=Galbibacter sp. BG1 TaxID=1170699 RepID=UPI0015C00896|nr:chemotaxis protein CheB [Galbibacter sp. BG1]QLE00131.1 PAS domain-containing protein [Galbibacter sp. BG1]
MSTEKTIEPFPIVGIGASAGGIDSFSKFLSTIPDDSGMAYILVQHLAPSHESILSHILAKITTLPVKEITNDCKILPNHIYVIPENKMLEVTDHELKLYPRDIKIQHMPIDVFFSSLARVHGTQAIGVVLSGTARDGTLGLRDIKEYGGITFAEDPDMAAWDGMPTNAIEAGVVDFVLPAEEIFPKLIDVYTAYETNGARGSLGIDTKKITEDGLHRILSLVQQESGVDFSYYKRPTILRRIARRMAINQVPSHVVYLELLRENKSEQAALLQDLLIKVTSFFRDPEIFDKLKETVIPQLLENRLPDKPIRAWVTACATGEEAYSLAITFLDALDQKDSESSSYNTKIQIFASDISEVAINKARAGVYTAAEVQPLSKRQLDRYFTKIDGNYKVIKSLRDTIVFSEHNFLKDPPFSKLDLISCRNVLIYLDAFLQKKLLSTFHYALKDNGFLLLGKSETTGTFPDIFVPFSKQAKIYTRKSGSERLFQVSGVRKENKVPPVKPIQTDNIPKTDFRQSANTILLSGYTPASLIVDEHMEIVQINGNMTPFLEFSSGKPSHELMKIARKELAFELRNALHKAKESQKKVSKERISLKNNSDQFFVNIEVIPLNDIRVPYYLILFHKKEPINSFWSNLWNRWSLAFSPSSKNHLTDRNEALQRELEQVREDMHRISEDQEASNEELQSANEELLSSNEEMQSLNEELETSKEELQSTNEELVVVNRELMEKQTELTHTLNYLDAIIANLREPFVVLDKDFRVCNANLAYYNKFKVDKLETEGKSFFQVQQSLFDNPKLRHLIQKILSEKDRVLDEEIIINFSSGNKKSFMFNVRKIENPQESKKLILLSLEDITERKMTESYKNIIAELQKTNEQLDRYVHVASHDLQEPLRKILIFSDLLLEDDRIGIEGKREVVEKISSSAARMSNLIKGLLEYSRVAHHEELLDQVNLNNIAKEILLDFELLIEDTQAKIKIGELPLIEAVPLQMNQLLRNLLDNGLKFTKTGVAPNIEISSHKLSKNEIEKYPKLSTELNYYEIIVSDKGIGFSPEYQEKIFLIFERLMGSLDQKGSGIGLSLVKKIVENHNGIIYTVSTEGNGAAFHVILPEVQPK